MKANAAMNPLDFRDDSTLFDGHCVRLDASCGPFPQRPFFENLVAGGQLTKVVSERISVAHGDMPEFIFEPEEIADLVEYLISIQVK